MKPEVVGAIICKTPHPLKCPALGEGDFKGISKEVVRSLQGEKDKDEDSCMSSPTGDRSQPRQPVDLSAVRRAYAALFKVSTSVFENALVNALVTLAGNLQMELQLRGDKVDEDIINALLIVFEIPALGKRISRNGSSD